MKQHLKILLRGFGSIAPIIALICALWGSFLINFTLFLALDVIVLLVCLYKLGSIPNKTWLEKK
jgi:hypothetical protein